MGHRPCRARGANMGQNLDFHSVASPSRCFHINKESARQSPRDQHGPTWAQHSHRSKKKNTVEPHRAITIQPGTSQSHATCEDDVMIACLGRAGLRGLATVSEYRSLPRASLPPHRGCSPPPGRGAAIVASQLRRERESERERERRERESERRK